MTTRTEPEQIISSNSINKNEDKGHELTAHPGLLMQLVAPSLTVTEPSPDELKKSHRGLKRSKTVETERLPPRPLPSPEAFARSEKKRASNNENWEVPNTPLKKIENAVCPWAADVPVFEDLKRKFPQNAATKWRKLTTTRTSTIYTAKESLSNLDEGAKIFLQQGPPLYVLKQLNPKFLARADQQEDAILEYANARKLGTHPNIVQYYNHWWAGSAMIFQIEYCPGGSLEAYLKTQPLKGKTREKKIFWNFFLDILLGLYYIHKKGYLHLDIKPGNIFLTNAKIPRLKIGDFGLLRHRRSTRRFKEGDGNYISPELLSSDSPEKIDDKADIFSLGVTLYEMATNFTLDRVVWQQICDGDLELSHMSPELSEILSQMLSRDPKKRPSALQLLQNCEKLRKLAASENIPIPSKSTDNVIDENISSEYVELRNSSAGLKEEVIIKKENLPTSPSRFAGLVAPTDITNVKRKLF